MFPGLAIVGSLEDGIAGPVIASILTKPTRAFLYGEGSILAA